MRLENKVCVVTGGASGIGQASAKALAAEGASVVVADVDSDGGVATADAIVDDGGRAIFVECDVSQHDDARALIAAAVEAFTRIDVLFNNAGVNPMEGSVVDMEVADWRRIFGINIEGIFLCSRYAIPEMRKTGGGRIINTASPSSFKGWSGNAAYIASKGAVMALTRAMAMDHAAENITVNAIVPGLILTPLGQGFLDAQPDQSAVTEGIPVGRAGTAEDVAPLVVHLASDESGFSTGAPFFVDGGELAG